MASLRKLTKADDELYTRVDEVLHYLWDPIGVSGCPGARDEYASYVPHVVSLLKSGASADAIADHLGQLTTMNMGMKKNIERDLLVAETLIDWNEELSNG